MVCLQRDEERFFSEQLRILEWQNSAPWSKLVVFAPGCAPTVVEDKVATARYVCVTPPACQRYCVTTDNGVIHTQRHRQIAGGSCFRGEVPGSEDRNSVGNSLAGSQNRHQSIDVLRVHAASSVCSMSPSFVICRLRRLRSSLTNVNIRIAARLICANAFC